MNKLATVLLFVNFITVLFPQPGYIHPDEFLQSTEVVAGNILGVSHTLAWEFNSTFPVRSMVFPYIVTSPSLYFLRWLNSTGVSGFQLSAVKIVMATRLSVAFLSTVGYLATAKLASTFHTDPYVSSVLYCSSYVCWTYYTRPFSNSTEAVLLAVVLILTLSCSNYTQKDSHRITENRGLITRGEGDTQELQLKNKRDSDDEDDDKDEKEDESPAQKKENSEKDKQKAEILKAESKSKCEKAKEVQATDESDDTKSRSGQGETAAEKARPKPQKAQDTSSGGQNTKSYPVTFISFLLGIVIMAGFFNRPTFLTFAFVPTLFWLWNIECTITHGKRWGLFFSVFVFMGMGASVTFLIFVLLDTIYYHPQFLSDLLVSFKSCVEHGFSEETLKDLQITLSAIVVTPWNFIQYNMDPKNLAQHGIHPRFTHLLINLPILLGPLYIPFVVVSLTSIYKIVSRSKGNYTAWLTLMALVPILSLSVFPHQEPRFLIPLLPVLVVIGNKLVVAMVPAKLSFYTIWIIFNLFLTLVYGYMHQAALIPALSIFQQKLPSLSPSSAGSYHVIFYKTYPPPHHLLLLNPSKSGATITDLAGSPIETLVKTVQKVKTTCQKSQNKCEVFIFLPATTTLQAAGKLTDYKISATSICPHLSMEAPPRFQAWWGKRLSFDDFIMDFCLNILRIT